MRAYVDERGLYIERECWKIDCDIDRTPALLDELGAHLACESFSLFLYEPKGLAAERKPPD